MEKEVEKREKGSKSGRKIVRIVRWRRQKCVEGFYIRVCVCVFVSEVILERQKEKGRESGVLIPLRELG